jgi:hypothetical protein
MISWREYFAKIRGQANEDVGVNPVKYVTTGRAGDIARCVNGHELYRLLSDVTCGTAIQSGQFEPIGDAPKPVPSGKIQPCHICGLPWIVVANPGALGGYAFADLKRKFEP